MSINGVVGRVLLTLFQQSYKGFKGKFFKICCNKHDPTLLDGFPLYWVEKTRLKKPRSLEDLTLPDCEVCQLLSSLGVVFIIVELIKLEYNPKAIKGYIGILSCFCFYLLAHCVGSLSYALLFSHADMVLNEEKRRMLAEAASKRKAGAGPSDVDVVTPTDAPATAITAPKPLCSNPGGS